MKTTVPKQKPMKTGDGKQIRVGDDLWFVQDIGLMQPVTVVHIEPKRRRARLQFDSGREFIYDPTQRIWGVLDATLFADWGNAKDRLVEMLTTRHDWRKSRLTEATSELETVKADLRLAKSLKPDEGIIDDD